MGGHKNYHSKIISLFNAHILIEDYFETWGNGKFDEKANFKHIKRNGI